MATSSPWRRTRIERGVYMQPNGKCTVCVRIGGKPRFRTVDAATAADAASATAEQRGARPRA